MNRLNISKRGVQRTAEKAGRGHVTAQRPPTFGGERDGACYVQSLRDAEERERVRAALARIGFGSGVVDQPLPSDADEDVPGAPGGE